MNVICPVSIIFIVAVCLLVWLVALSDDVIE
jgi:hypothetical protein